MHSTFRVLPGDTLANLSRRAYGVDTEADLIARANPGVIEPLVEGTEISIPELQNAPKDAPQAAVADNPNEVALSIDGQRFRFWESVRITRSIDGIDVIEFSAPFEQDAPGFRETFVPFSFAPLSVTVGGVPLLTGTLLTVSPELTPARKSFVVGGYATPGVLNDCTASPASPAELEFAGLTLDVIAESLAKPFGISVVFRDDPGSAEFASPGSSESEFGPDPVAIQPGQRVFSFLADLAKQKNLLVSSSPTGELVFQRGLQAGETVANLRQGESPLTSVKPFFRAQEYYSHVTGIESVYMGLGGSQHTVLNERLKGVVRPFTFTVPDMQEGSVVEAVKAKAGRMFASAASYSVKVATWRDPKGRLWEPNTFINLEAPDAMVYESYKFIIRSIVFERDRASEKATLNLVLPGSFSGEIPESLPWLP